MNEELPSVSGHMEMTHEHFQIACRVLIKDEQDKGDFSDKTLVRVLCEAVRCSREACQLAKNNSALASRIPIG